MKNIFHSPFRIFLIRKIFYNGAKCVFVRAYMNVYAVRVVYRSASDLIRVYFFLYLCVLVPSTLRMSVKKTEPNTELRERVEGTADDVDTREDG